MVFTALEWCLTGKSIAIPWHDVIITANQITT